MSVCERERLRRRVCVVHVCVCAKVLAKLEAFKGDFDVVQVPALACVCVCSTCVRLRVRACVYV